MPLSNEDAPRIPWRTPAERSSAHAFTHPRRRPNGWSRSAASTASATPTSRPSSPSPRPACTTTSPARPTSAKRSSRATRDASLRRWMQSTQTLSNAPAKLAAYATSTQRCYASERMCLCGMLAAEYETLPGPIRRAVIDFLRRQRGVARNHTRAGPPRRHPELPRLRRMHRPKHRQRPRGRAARRPPVRSRGALRISRQTTPRGARGRINIDGGRGTRFETCHRLAANRRAARRALCRC